MTAALRITTGSRLHFGLLGWGGQTRRQFGSVGLMIDTPGNILESCEDDAWSAVGPHSTRVLTTARQVSTRLGLTQPLALRIIEAAPEHAGLGTGTQLSLAAAHLIAVHGGVVQPTAAELAAWTGRGRRSGIGLHGFLHGGLLVDGGRLPSAVAHEGTPPLVARADWPPDWSLLVVLPPIEPGLHGPEETRAFDELPPMSRQRLDRIGRLVLLELLPALAERDLDAFGASLEELQHHVGAAFAPAQGGVFAEPALARIAAALRESGFKGVGQSSWGPALYGIVDAPPEHRASLAADLIARLNLPPHSLTWTQGRNTGALIEPID